MSGGGFLFNGMMVPPSAPMSKSSVLPAPPSSGHGSVSLPSVTSGPGRGRAMRLPAPVGAAGASAPAPAAVAAPPVHSGLLDDDEETLYSMSSSAYRMGGGYDDSKADPRQHWSSSNSPPRYGSGALADASAKSPVKPPTSPVTSARRQYQSAAYGDEDDGQGDDGAYDDDEDMLPSAFDYVRAGPAVGTVAAVLGTGQDDKFYASVDAFLNVPPPSVKKFEAADASMSLPKLREERRRLKLQEYKPKQTTVVVNSAAATGKNAAFDYDLLQKAFEYAQSVSRDVPVAVIEPEKDTRRTVSAPPAAGSLASDLEGRRHNRPRKKKSGATGSSKAEQLTTDASAAYGTGRPPRQRSAGGTRPPMVHSGSSSSLSGNPKAKATNYDDLVANFESGASLQRLREELAESQASLKESNQFISSAAHDWFAKGGRQVVASATGGASSGGMVPARPTRPSGR